jgi:hypothetical protein
MDSEGFYVALYCIFDRYLIISFLPKISLEGIPKVTREEDLIQRYYKKFQNNFRFESFKFQFGFSLSLKAKKILAK